LLYGEIAAFVAVSPFDLTWENRPTSSFVLFKQYLQKLDTDIKCKALRAMSGIFFAHPRVMLGSSQWWREISVIKETKVESVEAERQMESNTNISTFKKVSGDQDGDASLIGSLCIQHSPRLHQMTASMDSKVILYAILLLETLSQWH
jgi:hypothetical protein